MFQVVVFLFVAITGLALSAQVREMACNTCFDDCLANQWANSARITYCEYVGYDCQSTQECLFAVKTPSKYVNPVK